MLGLLEAILSQTRRVLTKVLRLDTDYTTARAGKIDNLDTTVSSRLADVDASTRTQTGMTGQGYTVARGNLLGNLAPSSQISFVQDGLDGNGFTSALSSQQNTALNGGSVIRSIQRGSTAVAVNTTVNVGISGVILGKAFVSFGGFTGSFTSGGVNAAATANVRLTSSTNIELSCTMSGVTPSGTAAINWEVIEYN